MDGDSNDEGTVTESLNGETKPDPAKLAQTAIIKQDVMLSATSTQSPLATVSSVFTMPNISMPTVSLANSGGLGGLTDHLFMSHIPADPPNAHSNSVTDSHTDKTGLGSLASPSQLFGQPQVAAPQFFLTGNGAQQFISIPVSLGTGGNHQIQLLTTSNGQIIATNLGGIPGLTQPLNLNLNSGSNQAQNNGSSSSTSGLGLSNLPQLLTAAGAQGQILAVGPQNSQSLTNGHLTQSSSQPTAAQSAVQSAVQSAIRNAQSAKISNQSSVTSLSEGLPPSVSQLLPNTVGNSTESTTVDGINLDEIKEFAKQFKIRRLSLGLTQTQVGQALSATEGPAYSQSAICRFEKLDITPKSAQKIKPVLERWMQEAEERYKNGIQNLTDFIGSEPSKKRKRRTSFTPQALEVLNNFFERNTHPSGAEITELSDKLNYDRSIKPGTHFSGAEMTELSDKLNYDREVIRVWFCNKRQALKNTIKKLKQETP
ncbi:POU domain, class 6, transcription factor 1-like isoform X2 [Ostrea edulis]|uniref:POU domain, class 6, transcription factor 1-like isoform X2 n=1 Tax=Ostrea edulis TaxID=37623 RepID=UPI00209531C1|nr:POU domain, class 6, transcription factor 1-like isoform X2 [Ostrea edulis]